MDNFIFFVEAWMPIGSWKQWSSPERWYPFAELHGVITQKTTIYGGFFNNWKAVWCLTGRYKAL
jgi:hypothetical protein